MAPAETIMELTSDKRQTSGPLVTWKSETTVEPATNSPLLADAPSVVRSALKVSMTPCP